MISSWEYRQLTQLAFEKFGISMGEEKRTLVVNRLQPLLTQLGLRNFDEYYHYLKNDKTGQALIKFINQLTTNYSFFFRETEHFDFLQKTAIPQRFALEAPKRIQFWSAGCSTGEEVYSLAIVVHEFCRGSLSKKKVRILGTDIDTNVLEQAYSGVYNKDRLRNTPPIWRMSHFAPEEGDHWQIQPYLRDYIHFSRYNLIRPRFEFKNKFFAIFCRNVMIYFKRESVKRLVQQFYDVTENQGYLFIGLTESLMPNENPYHYVAPSIYQKRE